VGVVGKNGIGKSTFLNIIQELETPTSGKVNVGDTVVFGNFSQTGLDVKQDFRVIEYVKSFAESFPLAKGGSISASQFLELFLFPPDKQYTYLSSLSGGEKKRLHLLTILFRNPNFLILDEPTNDLDLPTLAVLESFLTEYQGCVMIVSHDRYFMDRLVDHLFVFEGGGFVRDFPGNYTQYRIWLKEQETAKANGSSSPTKAATIEPTAQVAPAAPAPVKKKMTFKEKHEFEKLEKEMPALEKEKEKLTTALSDETLNYDQITVLADSLTKVTQTLEEMELRWLELSEMAE
jgi:ATP-binding cassette subfamily F protein uup